MRLSVVFICASILVFSAEARGGGSRGGKGGKRGNGSRGNGNRGNGNRGSKGRGNKPGKLENSDGLPPWAKYCETLEKWAAKPGKEGMAKRCKCFNAKQAGEQVSSDC